MGDMLLAFAAEMDEDLDSDVTTITSSVVTNAPQSLQQRWWASKASLEANIANWDERRRAAMKEMEACKTQHCARVITARIAVISARMRKEFRNRLTVLEKFTIECKGHIMCERQIGAESSARRRALNSNDSGLLFETGLPWSIAGPGVALTVIAVVASIAIGVLAVGFSLIGEKRCFFATLCCIFVSASLRLVWWAFLLNGYGHGTGVAYDATRVVGRVALVFGAASIGLFAYTWVDAVCDTLFPGKRAIIWTVRICLGLCMSIVLSYSVAMFFAAQVYPEVYDATGIVCAGVGLLLASMLVVCAVAVAVIVAGKDSRNAIRNSRWMVLVFSILWTSYVARVVAISLFEFMIISKDLFYPLYYYVSETVSTLCLLIIVALSLGVFQKIVLVVTSWASKASDKDSSVPLMENDSVPCRYSL